LEIVWYSQELENRAVGRKSDADETDVTWRSDEKERLEGISKKKMLILW
jgi:hypothetical protein